MSESNKICIMARRPRLFAAGVLYHVIVRGNQRQKTFTAESDYQAYIERLARYRKKYDYVLHAYCAMPNHGAKHQGRKRRVR